MKEYILFLSQKKVFLPILSLLLMEISLQLGCYKSFLKKNSYAANVNLITDHVLNQKNFEPDYLILGTSIAYQGISLEKLNQKIKQTKKKVQSIAIPGSELVVQELAFRKIERKRNHIKTVIHIVEVSRPWATYKELILPNLAMISELNRILGMQKIYRYNYNVRIEDLSYIMVRLIAYRRDIRDFFLNPDNRIKYISQKLRENPNKLFYYENQYEQKISNYHFENIDSCIEETKQSYIPQGSDFYHKKALFETCSLAKITKRTNEENDSTKLYFQRLKLLYEFILSKKKELIIIFAPSSVIIDYLKSEERNLIWKRNLEKIFQDKTSPLVIANLQDIFKNKQDGDFYYDLIHLNQFGMEHFTEKISNLILELENRNK